MLEDGPSACERCGGELRRVFHPTGIIFRGTGFYKTDSRPSASGSTSDAPAKAAAKTDGAATPTSGSSESSAPSEPSAAGSTTGEGS